MDSESKLMLSVISEMISLLNSELEDPGRPSKFLSLASELISRVRSSESESESELITLIKKIIFVGNSVSESGPESQLVSQVTQMISIISSEEWDPKKEPEPELILLTVQMLTSFMGAMENSESELVSLINQIDGLVDAEELRERKSNLTGSQRTEQDLTSESKAISFSRSMYLESELLYIISEMIPVLNDEEPQPYFIALTSQLIYFVSSDLDLDTDSDPKLKMTSRIQKIISLSKSPSYSDSQLVSHVTQMISIIRSVDWNPKESKAELMSRIHQIIYILKTMDPDSELVSLITEIVDIAEADKQREPESKLISFITQLMFHTNSWRWLSTVTDVMVAHHISRIISLVNSMEPKQEEESESELMSLVNQTISLFHSMDLDSQPKPLKMLISLVSTESEDVECESHFEDSLRLAPEPEIISLIYQICSLVISMNPNWKKLICVIPQLEVILRDGKFQVNQEVTRRHYPLKWDCLPVNWNLFKLPGKEDITHFRCRGCNGENHGEYSKAPVVVKHPLHPKHSLQLVALQPDSGKTRKCYCCDDDLGTIFYYCLSCDYAMNVACLEKPPLLHRDHPRWHEHRLALFPRQAFLTCNLCSLADESSPIYMCPPCDFVVHQKCLNLPRVIRISRHRHRISFTQSFDQGDWFCGVCRRKIDNDYGGYSCIKDGCFYAAHSRCATQRNVWDRLELEGEPEEVEEAEVPPFVTISDGIIQHFSHQQHHLRLDENTSRDYDEDKLCRACTMPIYYGNFYSCIQCDYILHEACANLSRKMHHSIHPHLLTLVNYDDDVVDIVKMCSACPCECPTGFFYECGEEKCDFKLHVGCAIISEPLVHESHMHPLFLTSKPETWKDCGVCKTSDYTLTNETFNCIECDFSLCFECATLPQKLRYKYDKHMLTLSYGDETSTMTYWCEACEKKINPKKRFYMCDEYCCVTLHITCMLGVDLYIKPGSSWLADSRIRMHALPNNHHMSRPKCFFCKMRCPHKIIYKYEEVILCSQRCVLNK